MESTMADKLAELNVPMIIAMKGLSSNKTKSEIANSLAGFLRCPLINEDVIILNLQNSLSASSTTGTSTLFPEDLPFKIASQICLTQLQLQLNVVINTSLLLHKHFDHLLQLTNSTEARLVIIECLTKDQIDQAYGYKVEHVPVIRIDTTKPFVVEDLVLMSIPATKSHESVVLQVPQGEGNQSKDPSQNADDRIMNPKRFEDAHAHEFTFIEEPSIYSSKLCTRCHEFISGPTYKCVLCDEFILHLLCAETPYKLDDTIPKTFPLFYENPIPSEYNFPKFHNCDSCRPYSSECNDCLLQTHIKCGFLPTICRYENHMHPLSFVIMPFWFNYEYKCYACDKFGKFVSYKCYRCNLDFHVYCVIMRKSSRNLDQTTTQEEAQTGELKIIGGQSTESTLRQAYQFRRDMIIKAIGEGYIGRN